MDHKFDLAGSVARTNIQALLASKPTLSINEALKCYGTCLI